MHAPLTWSFKVGRGILTCLSCWILFRSLKRTHCLHVSIMHQVYQCGSFHLRNKKNEKQWHKVQQLCVCHGHFSWVPLGHRTDGDWWLCQSKAKKNPYGAPALSIFFIDFYVEISICICTVIVQHFLRCKSTACPWVLFPASTQVVLVTETFRGPCVYFPHFCILIYLTQIINIYCRSSGKGLAVFLIPSVQTFYVYKTVICPKTCCCQPCGCLKAIWQMFSLQKMFN